MKKEYRKAVTIEAERFDGSDSMMDEYHITKSRWSTINKAYYSLDNEHVSIELKIGDWIATCAKNEPYVISDEIFNLTCVEVKHGV